MLKIYFLTILTILTAKNGHYHHNGRRKKNFLF